MKNNRVLIFGAEGFVSSNLYKFLIKNDITSLALSSKEYDLTKYSTRAKLKKLILPGDCIVFTSFISKKMGVVDSHTPYSENIYMLESLLSSIEDINIDKFIYLSSDAVYDVDKMPLDEDSACDPIDGYGAQHLLREFIIKDFFSYDLTKFLILRLSNVYGFNYLKENYGPSLFVRTALEKNEVYLFGNGEEKRSHIYIDDLIIYIAELLHNKSFGLINVAITPSISFKKIATIVRDKIGKKVKIIKKDRRVPIVRKAYKWKQIFRYIYNLGRPINQIYHKTYTINKLKNYIPNYYYTTVEEGINKTIHEYKKKSSNTFNK